MEITNELAEKLLSHERNFSVRERGGAEYTPLHKGTRNGGREVPDVIRELIGVSGHMDTIASTAKAFDVSQSTVSQAKKGNVGVNRHDPNLKERIDEQVGSKRKDIADTALDRLAGMFETVITQENLSAIKGVKEAVTVAKDLSTIIDKTTPKAGKSMGIYIHLPRIKNEEEYEAIDILAKVEDKRIE